MVLGEKEWWDTSLVSVVIHLVLLVLDINHEHYMEESGVLFMCLILIEISGLETGFQRDCNRNFNFCQGINK